MCVQAPVSPLVCGGRAEWVFTPKSYFPISTLIGVSIGRDANASTSNTILLRCDTGLITSKYTSVVIPQASSIGPTVPNGKWVKVSVDLQARTLVFSTASAASTPIILPPGTLLCV